jgi:hypothetical protein
MRCKILILLKNDRPAHKKWRMPGGAELEEVNGALGRSERYLAIYKVIELRDQEMARLFNNPRRSIALTMLAQLRTEGLLAEDEFSSLSPETRSAIALLLGTP